jgi:hypothetical protein
MGYVSHRALAAVSSPCFLRSLQVQHLTQQLGVLTLCTCPSIWAHTSIADWQLTSPMRVLLCLLFVACRTGQYTLFMQRYADATRMAPYLLDALLPRIRAGRW